MMRKRVTRALKPIIGLFTLVMINLGTIGSLGPLPTLATVGLSSVSYYLLAFFLYFLPYALVCAELSTSWSCRAGIYNWITEAFHPCLGFTSVWLQWLSNIVWFPTLISYAASTLAFAIDPKLANNHFYTFCMVTGLFWLITLLNCFGMRLSGLASAIGMVTGVIVPGILVVMVGVFWWSVGNPSAVHFAAHQLAFNFHNMSNIAFLVGIIIGFSGLEMSASHAEEVKSPEKNYPRAILIAALIVMSISVLGSLAIATLVPSGQIDLAAGIMQTFNIFFTHYQIHWIIPCLAVLLSVGAITNANSCLVAPPKSLGEISRRGQIPSFFSKENSHRVPVPTLILQASILTAIAFIIFLLPTINESYWIFTDLAGMLYLVMYIVMFAASIRLRYKRPDLPRHYEIPGGKKGIWFVSCLGAFGSLFCLIAGFIPPPSLQTNVTIYETVLMSGMSIFLAAPFIIYTIYHLSKKRKLRTF